MHNVLVTGGSRGIGLAIVAKDCRAGYNVIAVARSESDALRETIGNVVRQGTGGLHFRAFDLSEVDAIPAFVKGVRDEFGAIYGLVNNAGIGTEGLLATMHNSEIEALLRLNVLSPGHSDKICGAAHDGRWRRPHHQHVVDHRHHRL
jgi:3-oxoacyl-[acyl-carrier protein] reductase